jgi:hypothetical protein
VVVSLLSKPEPFERQRGLVWGTIGDALRRYKGSEGSEGPPVRGRALPRLAGNSREKELHGETGLPVVWPSQELLEALDSSSGDLVYLSDTRAWLGGLRSAHAVLGEASADPGMQVTMDEETYHSIVTRRRRETPLVIERLY